MSHAELPLTELIVRAVDDENAKDTLYRCVYDELRKAAHRLNYRSQGELQTTELVNEVVLRIEKAGSLHRIANRKVFFSVAAQAMKQILIDQHRRQQRRIDFGGRIREALDAVVAPVGTETQFDFERLVTALDQLEEESPRQHAVIMHRYFGGLSVAETAQMLDVSAGTVERDWRLARAKLFVRLSEKKSS